MERSSGFEIRSGYVEVNTAAAADVACENRALGGERADAWDLTKPFGSCGHEVVGLDIDNRGNSLIFAESNTSTGSQRILRKTVAPGDPVTGDLLLSSAEER